SAFVPDFGRPVAAAADDLFSIRAIRQTFNAAAVVAEGAEFAPGLGVPDANSLFGPPHAHGDTPAVGAEDDPADAGWLRKLEQQLAGSPIPKPCPTFNVSHGKSLTIRTESDGPDSIAVVPKGSDRLPSLNVPKPHDAA